VILVVDDEKNIRRALRMVLEAEGYTVEEAPSAEEGLERLADGGIDALLLDVKLPGLSGIDALSRRATPVPTVMISGHGTIDDAVRATKLGAFDFLEKPLDRARVLTTVRNAVDSGRAAREVRELRAIVDGNEVMIGDSEPMRALHAQIAKVAPTRGRLLITGESGTGKELVARAIHRQSPLAQRPFVKVNCAAIAPDLIESELFGHEKGAFTGAIGRRRGLFEIADGGTLFLDEIGDMSASAQAKVLRVLQTGELSRVGGESTIRVDVRVLAATNKDLERAVRDGSFREDLFFRLNVIPLRTPPLRERKADLPSLVGAFVASACRDNGLAEKPVTPEAMARLTDYHWPGNVRELRNVIERAVILSDAAIGIADLPEELAPRGAVESAPPLRAPGEIEALTLREFRDQAEREFIRRRLEQLGWNISRTAEALGIERTNLHRKLRAYGIVRDQE
jgi:DNA-binding NtrC family response regulator